MSTNISRFLNFLKNATLQDDDDLMEIINVSVVNSSDGGGDGRARRLGPQAGDGRQQGPLRTRPVLHLLVLLLRAAELQLQQPTNQQEQR